MYLNMLELLVNMSLYPTTLHDNSFKALTMAYTLSSLESWGDLTFLTKLGELDEKGRECVKWNENFAKL